MRTSCNGCRVLRKGCSDDCIIRPCLHWIKSPDAQANATVFLAKFYGRAGLLNLLNAGPDHLRPAIFQSLLYEACGRVVDPVYGSVGLLYSGQWQHCQVAVDAVLKGLPIMQLSNSSSSSSSSSLPHHMIIPPTKLYDIRHMSPSSTSTNTTKQESDPLVVPDFQHPKVPTRPRLRRRPRHVPESDDHVSSNGGDENVEDHRDSIGVDSLWCFGDMTTAEDCSVAQDCSVAAAGDDPGRKTEGQTGESEMGLELTLGFSYDKYGHQMRY